MYEISNYISMHDAPGKLVIHDRGGSRIFICRGVQNIMCPHAHYERETQLTFGRDPGPASPIHAQGLFLEGLNPYFIIQIGNIFS